MIEQITYNSVKAYSNFDPTRTTSLRNAFAKEMRRRFDEIIMIARKAIVDQDCFGLKGPISVFQVTPPGEEAFAFPRSRQKIEEFMKWLEEQVDKGIVTVAEAEQLGEAVEEAWTNLYILDSYKRGVIRARMEMLALGMVIPTIADSGGIEMVMSLPFHMDRVGVLFTRVFSDLKGITQTMDSQISRILAQGMIDGDGPILLARKIRAVIDGTKAGELGIYDTLGRFIPAKRRAEMLARTEVIRAHHLATIQEYRNFGLLKIKVKAEFWTAMDDRVCEKCEEHHGEVMSLDEIEPMIPMHPMCRCIALPWVEELQKYY